MSGVVDRAEALAAELRREEDLSDPENPISEIMASTDIRDTASLPCLLVVPIPRRDYTVAALAGSFEVTWTVIALAPPPGDLEAARALEELVDHVADLVDVERAEPAAYRIPATNEDVPAYLITFTETATPTEE